MSKTGKWAAFAGVAIAAALAVPTGTASAATTGAPVRAAHAVAPAAAPAAAVSAATNPYTPQAVCGSNYTDLVSWFSISGGDVYLLYNPSNGYNCATTIKTSSIGTPTQTGVRLGKYGVSPEPTNSGNFSYFAGPLYLYAPGTCVGYGGVTSTSGTWWDAGPVGCS